MERATRKLEIKLNSREKTVFAEVCQGIYFPLRYGVRVGLKGLKQDSETFSSKFKPPFLKKVFFFCTVSLGANILGATKVN